MTELTVDLVGEFFGVDFNPRPTLYASSAIRAKIFVTRSPARPPFITVTDLFLNYTPGANALGVTGAAYTNNDLDTNTNTTLFDIDITLDQVSVQSPPNNGSLVAAS